MRDKILTAIATYIVNRPWWTLLWVMIITVVCAGMAGQLSYSTEYQDMLPQDDPSVIELNTIIDEYNAASTLYIVAEGDEQSLVAFANEIVPQVLALDQWISDVVYQVPQDFIADHGLMLVKSSDLENSRTLFEDPNLVGFLKNLNDSFEKEYIQSEEQISNLEQEQGAVGFLDGIQSWVADLGSVLDGRVEGAGSDASNAILFGSDYTRSWDRRMMAFQIMTTFTIYDLEPLVDCPNALDEIILPAAGKYGVDAGLTGSIVLGRDKLEAIANDSFIITILALLGVLILFMVSFRMVISPILAIITLLFGIIWAMGLAWPLVGVLNMMTSMMSVMLVGLGIDFSIHIIAVYTELRAKGEDILTSMVGTLTKSGKGIITGACTTAIAFMTLIFGETDGMRQFGLVLGVGIIMTMIAALTTLPMLLVFRERVWSRLKKNVQPKPPRDISYRFLGASADWLARHWAFSLVAVVIVVGYLGYRGFRLEMDYDSRNLMQENLRSVELQERLIEAFDMDPDNAMLTASSLEEAQSITERLRTETNTVGVIKSIVDLLPPESEQKQRRQLVADIGNTMAQVRVAQNFTSTDLTRLQAEFQRLEDNIMEIQSMAFIGGQDKVYLKAGLLVGVIPDESDQEITSLHAQLNPSMSDITRGSLTAVRERLDAAGGGDLSNLQRFQQDFAAAFKPAVIRMANTMPLTLESLPEEIRSQYVGKSGEHFLIYVFSNQNIWNREYQDRLVAELTEIDPRGTGMPIIYNALLKGMADDGKLAIQIALVVIFLLLLADFRSVRKALLAILPLIGGVLITVGIMEVSGMMLTLMGIVVIPIIIGIGIDDGVHIIHRYNIEGKDAHRAVFASTGRAVLLTSLTTMVGFGSLSFATFRGLSVMGDNLFIGVGACFVATMLIIPVLAGMGRQVASRRSGAIPGKDAI